MTNGAQLFCGVGNSLSIPGQEPDLPATMYALQVINFGLSSESFQYIEIQLPVITRPTQVLIQVYAAGVNSAETRIRPGNVTRYFERSLILGADFSGVVVGKGVKVPSFKLGDKVFGRLASPLGPQGTYSEYTIVDVEADVIAKKPDSIPFIEAGAMGTAAMTAYEAVVNKGKLSQLPKDVTPRVVIIGASGGVGTFAVQIAKSSGAKVIGVCSKDNAELVKSLGAELVVDHDSTEQMNELLSEKDTFDLVVDCVGGDDYYSQFISTIKSTGVFVSTVGHINYGGSIGISIEEIFDFINTFSFSSMFSPRKITISDLPPKSFTQGILPLVESGSIKSIVLPENIYELKDTVKAHEAIETLYTSTLSKPEAKKAPKISFGSPGSTPDTLPKTTELPSNPLPTSQPGAPKVSFWAPKKDTPFETETPVPNSKGVLKPGELVFW
ncbi:hypothetical protein CLU79DRAFT_717803 [Phycomyces nitens]|nr:hypothetical protein CLU79DRAFT_717803 [Phycomyces nitens]